MTRLACACLRCRDAEYFYFDADAVRRYTSDILILTSGDQMCGQTHTGWSEEVYSFHQKFSHTADELTLKVRARSVGAWAAVCVGACVCPFFTYVFSGARAASLTSSTARRASLQPDAPALTRVLWFVCDVVDDVACGSVVVVCDLVDDDACGSEVVVCDVVDDDACAMPCIAWQFYTNIDGGATDESWGLVRTRVAAPLPCPAPCAPTSITHMHPHAPNHSTSEPRV